MGIILVILGTLFYIYGQLKNKLGKYLMGVPIGILGAYLTHSLFPLFCLVTYFIACEIGYGENNPLTKLVGKRWAITIHGGAVGLASFPLLGWWSLLSSLIAALAFRVLSLLDDSDRLKEPWIAILRGVFGTITLLGA